MYSLEVKITVASRFNCQSIGHFEEDFLNLGNAILESQEIEASNTKVDATIDMALAESITESDMEESEQISSDEAIAEYLAADKAADCNAKSGSSLNETEASCSVE